MRDITRLRQQARLRGSYLSICDLIRNAVTDNGDLISPVRATASPSSPRVSPMSHDKIRHHPGPLIPLPRTERCHHIIPQAGEKPRELCAMNFPLHNRIWAGAYASFLFHLARLCD